MDIPTTLPANANETQTYSERAITISACVLVGVVVFLRYLGRWSLQRRIRFGKSKGEMIYGLDDVFNVLAVLTFYGLATAVFIAINKGMGTHVTVVLFKGGINALSDYSQAIFVCALFYNTVLGMIKLSVLSLYLRILRGVQSNRLRVVVWAVFAIVAINTTANVCCVLFQCWPIKAAWDLTIPASGKRCIDVNAFYLGNAITGVITDATVYFLSVPIVKPLQMDGKTKLQLLATMLIGAFAVITSAVRLGFMPALLSDPDASMAMGVPMDWSVVEPAVGILVSSMPAIRAIRYLWRDPMQDSYASGGHSTLKSRNQAEHFQMFDMQDKKTNAMVAANSDCESGRPMDDNESEENLVIQGSSYGKNNMSISRTTELEVSYGPR